MEGIRMVVWDLDDTFWRGTLTEGGIEYVQANHDLVIELARRGIVSSICSRNDRAAVEAVLREQGIWEYFVFPSIDWSAKGPRLAALIDAVQLRAPTILFIDDNPMNLGEARHFVPGIQVADQQSIPSLLENPLLAGKEDSSLSRLRQYQVLELRKRDSAQSADTAEFLRESGIQVRFDHDIEANIDRAVELINRTNQLNFTKCRLPEDPQSARSELRALLSKHWIQAGLIAVRDRYGDYGYCGLYVVKNGLSEVNRLIHFCFSCRVLGMGVETWLYRRLGRPRIDIVDDVVTNILDEERLVDWVGLEPDEPQPTTAGPAPSRKRPPQFTGRILIRGACDLLPVAHYLKLITADVVGEYATQRDRVNIRLDHSLFLRYALTGVPADALASFYRLGFVPADFKTELFDRCSDRDVWLFGLLGDSDLPIYRHKSSGARIPFQAGPTIKHVVDWRTLNEADIDESFRNHWIIDALRALREEYEWTGPFTEAEFKENFELILSRIPPRARVFIIGASDRWFDKDGLWQTLGHHVILNNWCQDLMAKYPNVAWIDVRPLLITTDYLSNKNPNHFDRRAYFRIYEDIERRIHATGIPSALARRIAYHPTIRRILQGGILQRVLGMRRLTR